MNYTLHQLRVFLKITQTQSITKAAEELFLTQPAVSIQLKNFQDQFESPLTEVVGRKLYITGFGKEIAEASEKILNEVQTINYKALAFKGQLAGKLTVSVVSTGKYVMPYFMSDYLSQHPGIDLVMDVTNKMAVVDSLEKNEVDFALVSVLPENLLVEREPLMKNDLYFVGNRNFDIEKKQYTKKIFNELPLIFREKGSATRKAMENYIIKNNLQIGKKMELTSNEAVKQAVIAGLGYSVMPLIGIRNELMNKSLQIIPVKGFPITTVWNLVWLKSKKLSVAAEAYLQYIRAEKEKIIGEKFEWFESFPDIKK